MLKCTVCGSETAGSYVVDLCAACGELEAVCASPCAESTEDWPCGELGLEGARAAREDLYWDLKDNDSE